MTDETIGTSNSPNPAMEEEEIPMKVLITNPPQEIKDNTQWDEPDPWDFIKMTDEDIKEAEESRNA